MTIRLAPYHVSFEVHRTAEAIYTVSGVNGKTVATVTCDRGTQQGLAYAGISSFLGFVQDVNQVVHYDGYNDSPHDAEGDEYVSECLTAVARYVREAGDKR
jgi:hypothetical protein